MIVLKATQERVLSVLQSVSGIVERRHTLPILANVLIRKTGSSLQFTTSDLEIQIRTESELDGDTGNFTTTVGARKLIDILRSMPSDQTVSLESSQNKLILKGGKSRFTLQTLPAEDFPLVQESASFGPVFSVPQKTLKDLLNQVSFSMAVHDIRYYLNGILFVAEGKQLLALSHKQNAIQVVANVVHCHGKRDLVQQVLECFLRNAEHRSKAGGLLNQRKIFGRQSLQCEAAFAAFEDQLVLTRFQADGLVTGHGPQNIDQLACAHGGCEIAGVTIQFGFGANLNFQIAGGELQAAACFANQHIRQNGKCVATLNDARHRLQHRQNALLCRFQNDHVNLLISLI